MFYAEMDLRMKACIIGVTDSGSVDQVIERVKELLSDVDLDALLASIPSFEYYEEDNTIQV